MSAKVFKTTFFRDLCSHDVAIYAQLLLYARNESQFSANVGRLEKPALEATVYLLVMELQRGGGDGEAPLHNLGRWISAEKVLHLIEVNCLRLQKEDGRLGLLLNALGMLVLMDDSCNGHVSNFVARFREEFRELPVFYDVLRTLLIVALEKEDLQKAFDQLDTGYMIKNLHSESQHIRMKSLACLQLLSSFQPGVLDEWLQVITLDKGNILPEHRSFMLCHLVETAVHQNETRKSVAEIVNCERIWQLIKQDCESEDVLVCKQAISAIKNILTYLNEVPQQEIISISLFRWNTTDAAKITESWQCFMTILETLQESQTHLVLPALPLIEKLGNLAPEWRNSALKLVLRHDNTAVSGWGINFLLKNCKFDSTRLDLEPLLFSSMNRTTIFQEPHQITTLLEEYYRSTEGTEFLLQQFKETTWGSVPFVCILRVIDDLLKSAKNVPHLHETLNSLVAQTKAIKNLNLRAISALQLSNMVLRWVSRHDLELCLPPMDQVLLLLEDLASVSSVEFARLENWTEAQQRVNGPCFERLLAKVKHADVNIVRDVFVPYVRNERTSTEQRLKQILDMDLLLSVRILQYGNLQHSDVELKSKLDCLLKTFEEDSRETLDSIEIYLELCNNNRLVPLLEDIVQTLETLFYKRLNRLNYDITSITVTIHLTRLFAKLNRIDLVDLFLRDFSLDELTSSIQANNADKSLHGTAFRALSDVFLHRLQSPVCNELSIQKIIADYPKLIDLGDVHVLFNTLDMLILLLAETAKLSSFERAGDVPREVVNRCYREILVYRKSDQFTRLIKKFIAVLVAPWKESACSEENASWWLTNVVHEFCVMFLEQAAAIGGLANALFEELLLVPVDALLNWTPFARLLVTGLMLGDGQKREQRNEDEICAAQLVDLKSSSIQLPSEMQSDARVRIMCVLFLYRLAKTNHPDATLFLLKLERMLIEQFQQVTKSKERYYADSQTHRHKLRLIQALCVVFKLTGTKPYSLLEVVLYETNQPNINYLIELILADSAIDTLTIINSLKTPDRVKVSGVQSVFVILWLRCCKTNFLDVEYVNFLLPWTMAQNFSTRLYAQITISKLIEKFYDTPGSSESCPFANIYAAINSYLKQGNVEKNLERCMKDFRFNSVFDYENLLTLENVYNNIPRVSEMAAEDVAISAILRECFERLRLEEVNLGVAIEFDALSSGGGEKKENLFLSQGFGGSDHIQKKIVPLKALEPGLKLISSLPEKLQLKKKNDSEGLIVVASLVSRPPNLGGLARSCEIFAVRQYVVSSLKDLENKEFQALSMTAEKWLPVAELKPFQLAEYLREMKARGYAIVGAEQTTGSRPIQQIRFPRRAVLVLGHEKEGLPAHIISQLDIIGEIPQFGVVRSLNVHVTGAIFMWEYAKQHHVAAAGESS